MLERAEELLLQRKDAFVEFGFRWFGGGGPRPKWYWLDRRVEDGSSQVTSSISVLLERDEVTHEILASTQVVGTLQVSLIDLSKLLEVSVSVELGSTSCEQLTGNWIDGLFSQVNERSTALEERVRAGMRAHQAGEKADGELLITLPGEIIQSPESWKGQ